MTEGLTEPAQLLPPWARAGGETALGTGRIHLRLLPQLQAALKLFTRQVLQPCLENTSPTQLWTLQQVFTALLCSTQCFTPASCGQTGPGASAQSPAPRYQQCQGSSLNPSRTNSLGVTLSHCPVLLAEGGEVF